MATAGIHFDGHEAPVAKLQVCSPTYAYLVVDLGPHIQLYLSDGPKGSAVARALAASLLEAADTNDRFLEQKAQVDHPLEVA